MYEHPTERKIDNVSVFIMQDNKKFGTSISIPKKNRKILPQLYNISIGNLRKGVILYFVKKKIHFISVGKLQILRTKLIAHSGTPNCDEKGGRGVAAVWYPRGCLPFS